jgi:hypothetical protein
MAFAGDDRGSCHADIELGGRDAAGAVRCLVDPVSGSLVRRGRAIVAAPGLAAGSCFRVVGTAGKDHGAANRYHAESRAPLA